MITRERHTCFSSLLFLSRDQRQQPWELGWVMGPSYYGIPTFRMGAKARIFNPSNGTHSLRRERGSFLFRTRSPCSQFQICYRRGIAVHGENDLERERQELNLLPAHRVRGWYKEVEVQAPFFLHLSDNSTYCRLSVHARTVWAWPHVTNH